MAIASFHAQLEGGRTSADVVSTLQGTGLVAVIKEAQEAVSGRLRVLGLTDPEDLFARRNGEVLTTGDGNNAILLRDASRGVIGGGRGVLDVLIVGDQQPDGLAQVVRDAVGAELSAHSWKEAQAIGQLQGRLGGLSPNGKLLADPAVREAARSAYDDEIRGGLKAIVAAFRDLSVPRGAIEKLDVFMQEEDAFAAILRRSNLMSRRFAIHCGSCDTTQLAFATQRKASSALTAAGGNCSRCGNALRILETFAVYQPYLRAVEQGLWLESLASDVLASKTDAIWTGQMVESNEMDVLGVFAGRTVLIECKDTSFGQNDLYIAAIKAQQVGAEAVLIVSTEDLHQNVVEGIARITPGSQTPSRRP